MSDELSRKLGYTFRDANLLTLALTHRSKSDENNERLEFLGDSLVNCIIADALFQRFPRGQEGELSRWRATLINRDTLGLLGREFDLGRYLRVGMGELKSGGTERTSILSCAMEAVIGAIYLDAGFAVVQDCVMRWYQPLFNSLSNAASHKDPKTQLQEYLQKKHLSLPVYDVLSVAGETHLQVFNVRCRVADKVVVGQGSSRRRAEQDAAVKMLGVIKK